MRHMKGFDELSKELESKSFDVILFMCHFNKEIGGIKNDLNDVTNNIRSILPYG